MNENKRNNTIYRPPWLHFDSGDSVPVHAVHGPRLCLRTHRNAKTSLPKCILGSTLQFLSHSGPSIHLESLCHILFRISLCLEQKGDFLSSPVTKLGATFICENIFRDWKSPACLALPGWLPKQNSLATKDGLSQISCHEV